MFLFLISMNFVLWFSFGVVLQMKVVVTDQGIPQKSDQVDVRVNVLRNTNGPTFTMQTYSTKVDENTPYGTIILNTSASDPDAANQPNVSLPAFSNHPCCALLYTMAQGQLFY